MIHYISTRRPGDPKSFTDVLLSGMAPDGGLYIPDSWPELDHKLLDHLVGVPYATIASQIITPFIGNSIDESAFQAMLEDTYSSKVFDRAVPAPLVQIGPNAWIMELFHGPTLSFKDYALQLLGRLFDHVLKEQDKHITIVCATSGDTGSAAIEACRHCRNIDIFVLHPHGMTSEIQRRQMTTVDSPNVFNIAIEGNFDDCQNLLKAMFADKKMRHDLNLSTVNSINWVRIMAQTVYYFTAALSLGAPDRPVSFVVPTGNFGNIYAAWTARRMGLPIHKLIIATNRNDILTRFFETGKMRLEKLVPSLSPSMDIQISSNFERFLCDLMGRNHDALSKIMNSFRSNGSFAISDELMEKMRREFDARRCSDTETLETINACYKETGIMIDPHTAVGVHAAMARRGDPSIPVVILSCAHPAKFPKAVRQATGKLPPVPARLAKILKKDEKFTVMKNDLKAVQNYIRQNAKGA